MRVFCLHLNSELNLSRIRSKFPSTREFAKDTYIHDSYERWVNVGPTYMFCLGYLARLMSEYLEEK